MAITSVAGPLLVSFNHTKGFYHNHRSIVVRPFPPQIQALRFAAAPIPVVYSGRVYPQILTDVVGLDYIQSVAQLRVPSMFNTSNPFPP